MIGDFFNWLISSTVQAIWPWVSGIAYWVVAIGGTAFIMMFFVTGNKGFASKVAGMVIIYLTIVIIGGVIA